MARPNAWPNPSDDDALYRLRSAGLSWAAVGAALGRTGPQCCQRAAYLRREGRWGVVEVPGPAMRGPAQVGRR